MAVSSIALGLLFAIFFTQMVFAQFEDIIQRYDTLSTIAGKGDVKTNGVNGWLAEYEGASATAAELSRPHMAMADTADNIYIADKSAHAIRKITSDGSIVTVVGTGVAGDNGDGRGTDVQLNDPNGLWVLPDGTVYILDLGNSKIRRLDVDGMVRTIAVDPDGIRSGRGLWASNDGELIYYASETRVRSWTMETGLTTIAEGFIELGGLIVDPKGDLTVTDRGGSRVYRIELNGEKQIIAGNGTASGGGSGSPALETGLAGVRSVWFLENGSYFLATHAGSQIWYVDVDGIIHLFLNGRNDDSHSGDGEHFRTSGFKISEPRSITLDHKGNILIVENDFGYVRKIRRDPDVVSVSESESLRRILEPPIPNPVSGATTIRYNLPLPGIVTLSVYDIHGALVERLVEGFRASGMHTEIWDADRVAPGVYFYRLDIGYASDTRSMFRMP